MAKTTNFLLTQLEVGQKEKEVVINQNFTDLDAKIIRFLGDLAADPATTGVAQGSTYFNTQTNKLKVLRATGAWVNVA